ncbi:MAG TPA: SAM-dependent methyltransferase, partial [Thermomicrobiales bacterium]
RGGRGVRFPAIAARGVQRYDCVMETTNGAHGNADLIAIIRADIAAAGGRITFARYMELALTHPVHGYYASGRGAPGREGADFLTAPETSPYFGRCLAVQIAECWERMGAPADFALWEPGAGAGTLAGAVLDALRDDAPAAYRAIMYWLDDLSPLTRDRAHSALTEHVEAEHVAYGRPLVGFHGVVLANEFVDALPVHRVRIEGGALHEAYVTWDAEQNTFAEQWDAPSTPELARFVAENGIALAEGQVAEVSLAALDWIEEVSHRIEQGYVIVVDYGDTAPTLYRPGRFPEGSLMCYYRHTANREPYQHVGEQDMTAHVDFSALERVATRAGLTTLGLTTQAAFLASLGLGEMLYAATQRAINPFRYIAERNAVVRLIEPSAMGRNRVLVLGKAVATEPPLRGLTEPPI